MRPWVVALLMTSLAFAGCFGGGDDEPHDECPDGHDSHADEAVTTQDSGADDQEETTADENSTGDDNSTGNLSLVQMRQPGNETGNETGDEASQIGAVEDDLMAMEHSDCPDHHDESDDSDESGDDGETVGIGAGAYLVASNETGEAPLLVNFTFGVTEIPQDEFLTWTLDVDGDDVADAEGNGNNLEGNFSYTYVNPGEFNVTFDATDGIDSWNDTLVISVIGPAEEEEEEEGEGEEEEESGPPPGDSLEGDWLNGATNCPHDLVGVFEGVSVDQLSLMDGLLLAVLELDPATAGLPWAVEWSGVAAINELDFFDTDGNYMSYTTSTSGEVPAGAGYAIALQCGVGPGSITYKSGAAL